MVNGKWERDREREKKKKEEKEKGRVDRGRVRTMLLLDGSGSKAHSMLIVFAWTLCGVCCCECRRCVRCLCGGAALVDKCRRPFAFFLPVPFCLHAVRTHRFYSARHLARAERSR